MQIILQSRYMLKCVKMCIKDLHFQENLMGAKKIMGQGH